MLHRQWKCQTEGTICSVRILKNDELFGASHFNCLRLFKLKKKKEQKLNAINEVRHFDISYEV